MNEDTHLLLMLKEKYKVDTHNDRN